MRRLDEIVKYGQELLAAGATLLHVGKRGWFDVYYVPEASEGSGHANTAGKVYEPGEGHPDTAGYFNRMDARVGDAFERATEALTKFGFRRMDQTAFVVESGEHMPKGHGAAAAVHSPSHHALVFRSPDVSTIVHEWAHAWMRQQPRAAKEYLAKWYYTEVFPEEASKLDRGDRHRAVASFARGFVHAQVSVPALRKAYDAARDAVSTFKIKGGSVTPYHALNTLVDMGVTTDAKLAAEVGDEIAALVDALKSEEVVAAAAEAADAWPGGGLGSDVGSVNADKPGYPDMKLHDFLKSEDCLQRKWAEFVDAFVSNGLGNMYSYKMGYDTTFLGRGSEAMKKLTGMFMRCFDWSIPRDKLTKGRLAKGAKWRRRLRIKLADEGVVMSPYSAVDPDELWSVTMEYMIDNAADVPEPLRGLVRTLVDRQYFESVVAPRVASLLAVSE